MSNALWKVFNKLKKQKDVIDSSMVTLPDSGGYGDIEGVVDLLLNPKNIIQLSKLKDREVGLLAFSLALVDKNVLDCVKEGQGGEETEILKSFLFNYMELSVSVGGYRSNLIRDIASNMLHEQFEIEKEKVKNKEKLDVT